MRLTSEQMEAAGLADNIISFVARSDIYLKGSLTIARDTLVAVKAQEHDLTEAQIAVFDATIALLNEEIEGEERR